MYVCMYVCMYAQAKTGTVDHDAYRLRYIQAAIRDYQT
jgi:hypothetical protein